MKRKEIKQRIAGALIAAMMFSSTGIVSLAQTISNTSWIYDEDGGRLVTLHAGKGEKFGTSLGIGEPMVRIPFEEAYSDGNYEKKYGLKSYSRDGTPSNALVRVNSYTEDGWDDTRTQIVVEKEKAEGEDFGKYILELDGISVIRKWSNSEYDVNNIWLTDPADLDSEIHPPFEWLIRPGDKTPVPVELTSDIDLYAADNFRFIRSGFDWMRVKMFTMDFSEYLEEDDLSGLVDIRITDVAKETNWQSYVNYNDEEKKKIDELLREHGYRPVRWENPQTSTDYPEYMDLRFVASRFYVGIGVQGQVRLYDIKPEGGVIIQGDLGALGNASYLDVGNGDRRQLVVFRLDDENNWSIICKETDDKFLVTETDPSTGGAEFQFSADGIGRFLLLAAEPETEDDNHTGDGSDTGGDTGTGDGSGTGSDTGTGDGSGTGGETVLSTNTNISSVTVNGTAGSVSGRTITVQLPRGSSIPTDASAVAITPTDAKASVTNLTTANNGRTWTFTVVAEDGKTTQDYTINVSVRSSSSSGGGGGSSSGGGGSRAVSVGAGPQTTLTPNGSWKEDATGWWFEKSEGGYPQDAWYECVWNNAKNWYHFNPQGYLDAGWFNDKDGNTYYLHDQHDNNFGYMYAGWRWIGGKCYYFNTSSGANGLPYGAMFKNTTTPDGYTVNAAGEWTVNGVVQTQQ